MAAVKAVQVNLFGKFVGAVAPLKSKPGFYEFSYAPDFRKSGLDIAPIKMKLDSKKSRFGFSELSTETYYGLPGLLADTRMRKFCACKPTLFIKRTSTLRSKLK